MKNMKNTLNKRKMEAFGAVLLLAVFVAPFLTFAGSRKDIYVDSSANGSENGSAAHPYHSISKALDHANSRTDVHVAKGNYEENITIGKGVKVFGSKASDVVIRADKKSKPVVTMKHNAELNKVTVKNGEDGILVKEDSNVSIIAVIVKDNEEDGIEIEKSDANDKYKVSIVDSDIFDNDGSGIFSKKRRLVLINNEIIGNGKDGVDIAAGSSAWIEDNAIRNNDKSGMKLTLDGSNIWTKTNTFKNNKNQGIEVNSWGGSGRIDINKSKFEDSGSYAIARNTHREFANSIWNGLTVQSNTKFDMNKLGDISPIIMIR